MSDYDDDYEDEDDEFDADDDDIEGADEDLADGEDDVDDYAESGELCPSCGEYLLDGSSAGDVIECPVCGMRVKLT